MSQDELSRSLSELQRALAERNLDLGRIADGLQRVAKALEPSALTRPVTTELFSLDLKSAAAETRDLAKDLGTVVDELSRPTSGARTDAGANRRRVVANAMRDPAGWCIGTRSDAIDERALTG